MREERMIPVPSGRLHAVAEGAGPPIVLLHAAVVDSGVWEPFVPLLTDAGYRTIRYDARGFGRSVTEDLEEMVAWLKKAGVQTHTLRAKQIIRGRVAYEAVFDTAAEADLFIKRFLITRDPQPS